MIHYIYKIVNKINNKLYVGYTNRTDPNSRWKQHITNIGKLDRPLYRAFIKYGIDNFIFEIVYCSKDGEYTLNTMENYFIIQYESHITKYGYNLTLGGESNLGWKPSDATRELWRNQRKGRKLSEEHKQKVRESNIKLFKDNPSRKEYYRQMALTRNSRPPIPTPETHQKGALTRTGKHIHSQQRKDELSNMFKTYTHPLQNPELVEKRKQTWTITGRGIGDKNGNAAFCQIYNPSNELLGSGHLKTICDNLNFPFNTFLAASRHEQPLQRGKWKGWRIIRIPKTIN